MNKDKYFMSIAETVSLAATCSKRKVGAVLVKDSHIISTGYNGAPKGLPHCLDVGCDLEHGHCVRCVHAEANALIQAGFIGLSTQETTMYVTTSPCRRCLGLIINAGIKRIVYLDDYREVWPDESDEAPGVEFYKLEK